MQVQPPVKIKEEIIGQMLEFLEKARSSKQPAKKERQLKPKKPPPIFKDINAEMQSFIVYLRYGSLVEPGPPVRSFKDISEITKLHQSAIGNVCKRWISNGCQVVCKKFGPKKKPRWFTAEMESYLTKPQTLSEWAHLSLHQRLLLIEQKFNVRVTIQTLAVFYKERKITYIKPKYAYCRKLEQQVELEQKQQRIVMEIT